MLITGAAGFIGSHLVDKLLAEGKEVTALDNFDPFYDRSIKEGNLREAKKSGLDLIEGDIRDPEALHEVFSKGRFEVVVHLAAKAGVRPSIREPLLYTEVNVMGTQNVLEACREHGVRRLVFASSSSVYGNLKTVPYSEDMNVNIPISPYAATKVAAELLCHNYWHLYGISCTCLRFFTVFGPRQRPEMAIHKFTRLIYEGKPVHVYGDGSSSRDYTYIDDVIQGVDSAITRDLGYEVINLGESATITLNDLLETLSKVTGREVKRVYQPPQPGDVDATFADIGKAKRLLDYCPTTPVEDGIRKFVDWYERVHHGS